MSWEEQVAGPYLPPASLAQLKAEHVRLQRLGFPRDQLLKHSRWEEALFAQYCPQEVLDQVLVDHEEWEAGRLHNQPAWR